MKRFWKTAEVEALDAAGGDAGGDALWRIALDGRPVKTPERRALAVPFRPLADGIAEEWRSAPETVDLRGMPLTQLAATVVDRIADRRGALEAAVAAYGETDLLCYRAEAPDGLVARQAKLWDPLLDWARARYGATLCVTSGILAVPQEEAATARLAAAVSGLDDWHFAVVQAAVPLFGSLVLGLAFVEREITAEAAFQAAQVEELYQAEQWGTDSEALARRNALQAETRSLARFRDLLRHPE